MRISGQTDENSDSGLNSHSENSPDSLWREIEREFLWSQTGEINIVHESVDRWARDRNKRDRKALIFEKSGKVETFSYLELREISSQWANLLIEYGFSLGDRLFMLLPTCPEIYFLMVACARIGVIFSPLNTNLNFDELEARFQNGKPRGIVTTAKMMEHLPEKAMSGVECVFLTDGPVSGLFPNEIIVPGLIEGLPKRCAPRSLRGTTPLYLIYTSGSTGPPKGVLHAHMDMVGHLVGARSVLNFTEGAVIWTDALPSWITGIVYGAFAPWICGAISVIQGDCFSASTWYRTMERNKVKTWYTTPGTLTGLAAAGDDLPARYDLSNLKHIATVGETLGKAQVSWVKQTLKIEPHDTWWTTETGMICLANDQPENKPGSMGRAMPGIEAAVLDENGQTAPADTIGELALKVGWPSMTIGLWHDAPRYQSYFRFKDWFLTGDMVTRDESGFFYHLGRNDDLVKLGDRFVGPYEMEHILSLHPAVAESAIVSFGSLDGRTLLKAFLLLNKGFEASSRLSYEIRTFFQACFSPALPLSEIIFMEELPKTSSGKILRRVLRIQEKGLPTGDIAKLKE